MTRLWMAVALAAALGGLQGAAFAQIPANSFPANERPELIFKQLIDQFQRPPVIPLDRVIRPEDYLPPPAAASFVTIDNDPVNPDLAPVDPTTAIHIR